MPVLRTTLQTASMKYLYQLSQHLSEREYQTVLAMLAAENYEVSTIISKMKAIVDSLQSASRVAEAKTNYELVKTFLSKASTTDRNAAINAIIADLDGMKT